jgi:integrase
MRSRGMGSIFVRGQTWWVSYYVRGQRHKESAESTNRADAVRLLKKRIAEAQSGKAVGHDIEKTTLGDLTRILTDEYQANRRRVRVIKAPLAHLTEYFGGGCRTVDITTDRLTSYTAHRQQQGAANSTINRSLAALKRAFTLAARAGKVASRPHVPMLEEDNARSGFLTHGEFERLRDALPADLRDPVMFLYYSGWRVGEMRSLEWRDVDLEAKIVRLRPENSKNKKGRVLPLRAELAEIIERAAARRIPECPSVFHRDNGQPVGLFRKSWATACREAGLGAILVHDLRRCAIRNMIRSGVFEKTAMLISGHRTQSVFERYNIVTEDDLARAIDQVSDHLAAQPRTPATVVPLRKVGPA